MKIRICNKCKLEKEISNYSKCKKHSSGFKTICKSCYSEYVYAYRKTEKGKQARKKSYDKSNSNDRLIISDNYLLTKMNKNKSDNIPKELLELKRINLLIKRELKNGK